MKVNFKKIISIIALILIFSMFILEILTTGVSAASWDNWKAYDFDGNNTPSSGQTILEAGSILIAILQTFSMGIAILMLVVFGIKYMLTSTADDKVTIKKEIPNYVLGAVLTFSAGAFLGLVRNFIETNINN